VVFMSNSSSAIGFDRWFLGSDTGSPPPVNADELSLEIVGSFYGIADLSIGSLGDLWGIEARGTLGSRVGWASAFAPSMKPASGRTVAVQAERGCHWGRITVSVTVTRDPGSADMGSKSLWVRGVLGYLGLGNRDREMVGSRGEIGAKALG